MHSKLYIPARSATLPYTVDVTPESAGWTESSLQVVEFEAGQSISLNTGDTDLVFLEMFKAPQFQDVSLNNWIRRMPPEMATAHLNLDAETLKKISEEKQEIIAG